jgi:hypothetical protein
MPFRPRKSRRTWLVKPDNLPYNFILASSRPASVSPLSADDRSGGLRATNTDGLWAAATRHHTSNPE